VTCTREYSAIRCIRVGPAISEQMKTITCICSITNIPSYYVTVIVMFFILSSCYIIVIVINLKKVLLLSYSIQTRLPWGTSGLSTVVLL
jgi:hypothetical protein